MERLHIVRLYDSYKNRWFDHSKPLPYAEAKAVWDNTKYEDGQYYDIFPADTVMMRR